MNINGLDYNTQRERLILPEYGREIQNMVDYCVALPTKEERQRCAATIVATMDRMVPKPKQRQLQAEAVGPLGADERLQARHRLALRHQ